MSINAILKFKNRILKLLPIAFLLCIGGCTGESVISATDFGFENITISARYDQKQLSNPTMDGQVAPWIDTNLRVTGRPLAIMVKPWSFGIDKNNSRECSATCYWYGNHGDEKKLSSFCERLDTCTFVDNQMCTDTKTARISNAPCIFKNGVGLYGAIGVTGSDINTTFEISKTPPKENFMTFHLGEPTEKDGYGLYDVDKKGNIRKAGGQIFKYNDPVSGDSMSNRYVDGNLYLKVQDGYYPDNSGQYRVSIMSGVTTTSPDPITFVTNLVKKFLFGTQGDDYGLIRKIYMGIINNPGYRTSVAAMLSLYIMWTALSYLSGNINITHTELLVRVMKISIVSALLSSEYSWSFFNDYLFVWFVGGLEQILRIIEQAGATGPGSSGLLGLMLAPQTFAKLFSLLFTDPLGWIYIILFFIALYFILIIYFEAAVLYLTALMAIGLIITMGPIFITFLLFGITKTLFENWLKQLISYALQVIVLYTGLAFMSPLLRDEIYGTLGFAVSKHTFPKMQNDSGGFDVISDATRDAVGLDLGDSLFYWWFPMPMKGEEFSRTLVNIPVPIDHYVSSGPNKGEFCEAYACNEPRYVDLPFLDPVKDARRINQFWNGRFVQLDGLLLIFVAMYLLQKFNGLAVSVAKFISDTSGNLTSLSKVSAATTKGIGGYASDRFNNTAVGRRIARAREKISDKFDAVKERVTSIPSKLVDKARIANLKKEASSKNPNSAVVAEVRKNTGLEHKDLKPGAIGDYKKALTSELKAVNPKITDRQARKIADQMSKRNFKALENEFAKAKYGKDLKDLNDDQRKSIKDIMTRKHSKQDEKSIQRLQEKMAKEKYGMKFNDLDEKNQIILEKAINEKTQKDGKSLRELANNANEARQYREAYVDAYAKMSERGIGLLGKHSSTIRKLDEFKHRVDEKEKAKEAARKATGQELYAGYENLKHGAYGALTGNRNDGFGQKFAGGSFNMIDTNPKAKNHRMMTHNEVMAEREIGVKEKMTDKRIENLSRVKGENVTSPEYIAKVRAQGDPNAEIYQKLANEKIKSSVRQQLSDGEDPALKGKTFMKDYAKDSDMRHMISRAETVKKEMLNNSEFARREEHHENKLEIASEKILDRKEALEKYFNKKDIKVEEMPALLNQYNRDNRVDQKAAQKDMAELQESIKDFNNSQKALAVIDGNKRAIEVEVNKHIGDINDYRKKAGMEPIEAIPPVTEIGVRSVRKFEDLSRDESPVINNKPQEQEPAKKSTKSKSDGPTAKELEAKAKAKEKEERLLEEYRRITEEKAKEAANKKTAQEKDSMQKEQKSKTEESTRTVRKIEDHKKGGK